jgi:hypothetical protein
MAVVTWKLNRLVAGVPIISGCIEILIIDEAAHIFLRYCGDGDFREGIHKSHILIVCQTTQIGIYDGFNESRAVNHPILVQRV